MGLGKFVEMALRKKTLEEAKSLETPLRRCLSAWHLVFYGIAHMSGAGIYVLSGTIIKNSAGPAASLSFLFCSLASLFTGLCYVEFGSLVPRSGSSYTYTYCVLGELPAFVVGWTMLFDYVLSMSAVAKAFSGTLDALTKRRVSGFLTAHLGRLPAWSCLDDTWDVVALALILLLALLVLGGARFSMTVNAALSSLQLLCLMAITGAAFAYGSVDNWKLPDGGGGGGGNGGFFPYGAPGVLEGASIAMVAFSGFESVSTAAEECLEPKRDLPRALLGSLLVVSLLYVAASLGLSFLHPYWQLDVASPFVSAFALKGGAKWAEVTAGVGTLLATGATKVSAMYVIPRLLYTLAADGVVFAAFGWVLGLTRIPVLGLLSGAILSGLLALVFRLQFLADMVSLGTLISYCATGVDLFVLRYLHFAGTGPDAPAPLRPWAAKLGSSWLPCLSRVRTLRWLFCSYVAACFAFAGAVQLVSLTKTAWLWALAGPLAAVVLLLFAALTAYSPHEIPGMYSSPLMPASPLVTILVNAMMLVRLSPFAWIRFFSWLKAGLTIYTMYGMWHSKVGEKDKEAAAAAAASSIAAQQDPPGVANQNQSHDEG